MSVIMRLFHKLRRSCFTADANEVVKIQGVEPRLDVFAGLAVLPNVFGEAGQSFGIAIRSPLFHMGRPGFDFPCRMRGLGVGVDPFENFAVGFSGSQLFGKGFEIEAEDPDEVLVGGGVVVVFAVFPGRGSRGLCRECGAGGVSSRNICECELIVQK
jgi:hypothetical protein